jgi:dATP/dGTP diphosphohydrolase
MGNSPGGYVNSLPTEAGARKAVPLASGCLDYFPAALAAVAALSQKGNDQHNPGEPLGWDRAKSGDEADALLRHFTERGTVDIDGIRHSAKVAWRALAMLQKELEAEEGAPLPRGARMVQGQFVPMRSAFAYDAHPGAFERFGATHSKRDALALHAANPVRQDTGD